MKSKKKLWFTMVLHPLKGWIRVGKAYGSAKVARDWVPFVRAAWRGCQTTVSQHTFYFIDGKMTEASQKILSEKYNLDAP